MGARREPGPPGPGGKTKLRPTGRATTGFQLIAPGAKRLDVSLVIPVLNEVESVPALAAEVTAALSERSWSWECVWVDDGSRDGTGPLLDDIAGADARHRVLHLTRNFGQSAAMAAGISAAAGRAVVTLDGDGQSDPADVPRLIEILRRGDVDVVNGVRARRNDSRMRRISSRIGNGFRNRVTGERVTDVGCSLRAVRRECFDGILVFRGMHRFLPTLIRLNGYDRIIEVPVAHRPRVHGTTKYGISNRLWVGLADTLAVLWMRRRLVSARIRPDRQKEEETRDGESVDGAGSDRTGGILGAVPGAMAGERAGWP